jgi:hypothetical protein
MILAPEDHPLTRRGPLTVADVIDETFIGFDTSVAPEWAGFWSLDDHRGAPPRDVTIDRAANPQEVLAALVVRGAITTVPASVATVLGRIVAGIVAIPLPDAAPSTVTMVGREDRRNPLVATLAAFARERNAGGELRRGVGAGSTDASSTTRR